MVLHKGPSRSPCGPSDLGRSATENGQADVPPAARSGWYIESKDMGAGAGDSRVQYYPRILEEGWIRIENGIWTAIYGELTGSSGFCFVAFQCTEIGGTVGAER